MSNILIKKEQVFSFYANISVFYRLDSTTLDNFWERSDINMKFSTQVVPNKNYWKIILKMSELSYSHADVSRKVKISKNKSFFKMAVTSDLNKIFQFFDILKGNRIIFNINSCFFYESKDLTWNGTTKITKLIFSFLARHSGLNHCIYKKYWIFVKDISITFQNIETELKYLI